MPRLSQNRPDQQNKGEPTRKTYTTEHPRNLGFHPSQLKSKPDVRSPITTIPSQSGQFRGMLMSQSSTDSSGNRLIYRFYLFI